jgi:anthranilate synthase component 1
MSRFLFYAFQLSQTFIMLTYKLSTRYKRLLADTLTPVGIYLKLRDHYANTFLLESSDYHGQDNSFSYICFDPVARFELAQHQVDMEFPDGARLQMEIDEEVSATFLLSEFVRSFQVDTLDLPFTYQGLFGYHSYDAVRYYEDVQVQPCQDENRKIPEMLYQVFRYVIAIDHFKNELYLFEHYFQKVGEPVSDPEITLGKIAELVTNLNIPDYDFEPVGEETSNLEDEAFLEVLKKGKEHCQLGDVFQIVLSRQYQQAFIGDEFRVYRSLRSINPSPYLFYCDYGDFKLFGSSPEAQLVIQEGQATIHPIAGTFRRTGNDAEDRKLAEELFDDPKENSEHVMLVDLARNDLSRNGEGSRG